MQVVIAAWGSAVFARVPRDLPGATVNKKVKVLTTHSCVPLGALALEPSARLSEDTMNARYVQQKRRHAGRKPRGKKPWQS
jgi:hypothetical protein